MGFLGGEMKVLLSGFDAFGGEEINPALEVIKGVSESIGTIKVRKIIIPTIFKTSLEVLWQEAKSYKPDVILSIGQAGGRYEISLERVAINIDDARIKDNAGNQPIDVPIFKDGKNAYFSNLPIKAMMKEIREIGIPAMVSNTAGTFVCNHVMYAVLYWIEKFKIAKRGGFIHIPYLPQQVINKGNTPYMDKQTAIRGIEKAIWSIGEYENDLEISSGKEC